MFELIHGSAFEITGKGVANAVATFWTCVEMLRWLGAEEVAERLLEYIENVCEAGIKTKDLGGGAGSREVTGAVCEEVGRMMEAVSPLR